MLEDIEILRPDPEYVAIVKEILAQNRLILEALCRKAYKVTSLTGECTAPSNHYKRKHHDQEKARTDLATAQTGDY